MRLPFSGLVTTCSPSGTKALRLRRASYPAYRSDNLRNACGGAGSIDIGCSRDKGLGLTGTMRLPRSPLFAPLLIIVLLVSVTGAGWAKTWSGSVVLWLLSGIVALVMFAALLRDSE